MANYHQPTSAYSAKIRLTAGLEAIAVGVNLLRSGKDLSERQQKL